MEAINNIISQVEDLRRDQNSKRKDYTKIIDDALESLENIRRVHRAEKLIVKAKKIDLRLGMEADFLVSNMRGTNFVEYINLEIEKTKHWISQGHNVESNKEYMRNILERLKEIYINIG